MKISIKNFGPISSFDFDLSKDFNVIFGKNNIGKSYAITTIYLLLKNLTNDNFFRNSFELEFYLRRNLFEKDTSQSPFLKQINEFKKEITKKGKLNKEEFNITKEIEDLFSMLVEQTIMESLEKSFINSFSSIDSLSNKFTQLPFSIQLFYDHFSFSIVEVNGHLRVEHLKLNQLIYLKNISQNKSPKYADDKIILYFNTKNNDTEIVNNILSKHYRSFKNEVRAIINHIYFLPASRSGLYQALSTFSAVIAELSKSRNFLNAKIELPSISEPVSDYFLYLSNISTKPSIFFSSIIDNIEEDILKGKINFNEDSKKIVFSPSNLKIELDLSFTSSMISEIAPIVAYLKYIIGQKERTTNYFFENKNEVNDSYNLIFIEEPEAHLHPEVQVKLLAIFCKLINLKVKIIMTSHSNYMFNKLSNLMLDSQIDYQRVGSYLMKSTDAGSVVDEISMKAEADGIQDENFVDVAKMLYEDRINIYDKLNHQK